jgi:hypothetical protein
MRTGTPNKIILRIAGRALLHYDLAFIPFQERALVRYSLAGLGWLS